MAAAWRVCTVSILIRDGVLRLVTNRDEQHTRVPAQGPVVHSLNGVRCCYPVDPASGGTWVGANAHGIVATLLNGNPPWSYEPDLRRSRGELVPAVLGCATRDAVVELINAQEWASFPPCRLVVAIAHEALVWTWDGRTSAFNQQAADGALFSSSGLGDKLVQSPRATLWADWFTAGADPFAEQDAFHAHSWPERGAESVCMRRDDACTVSSTTIAVSDLSVDLHYHPAPPDETAEGVLVQLPRVVCP